jgi:glycyl-tRNA synthetase
MMEMEKLVSLCRRRGFLFQSSEIYGGLNGFWDYGPLGVELKRNIKEAWWRDMVTTHDDLTPPPGAPEAYEMVGLDCAIIMHPQVWKVSGHYDLFVDKMVDCRRCRGRYRADHLRVKLVLVPQNGREQPVVAWTFVPGDEQLDWSKNADKHLKAAAEGLLGPAAADLMTRARLEEMTLPEALALMQSHGIGYDDRPPRCPVPTCRGELTEPRDFNLMFETYAGALKEESNKCFLRPETAQGIFVNFKNVLDSTRVRVPFGIAQVGKSFRNEITPRYFTFRSREFEQMEIEFFCHPRSSPQWYAYWRDRRLQWYVGLGLASDRLRLREHGPEELSHYSCGTSDIEYAFPFLPSGEFGELEGIAHRGDFDLRSHMEGKLVARDGQLVVESGPDGKPKWKGSGKDLTYRDDLTGERYIPHVIEPSAGADRATLAFLCEAYAEDQAPDEKGELQTRVVMRFHPRLAPIKAAVFPLVKKDGMPEVAQRIYRMLKPHMNVFYDEKGAIGRRYRRQDEAGTPFCLTVDGQTLADGTVTVRDRDTLTQWRVHERDLVAELKGRIG